MSSTAQPTLKAPHRLWFIAADRVSLLAADVSRVGNFIQKQAGRNKKRFKKDFQIASYRSFAIRASKSRSFAGCRHLTAQTMPARRGHA